MTPIPPSTARPRIMLALYRRRYGQRPGRFFQVEPLGLAGDAAVATVCAAELIADVS
jgi:hypothetical protein